VPEPDNVNAALEEIKRGQAGLQDQMHGMRLDQLEEKNTQQQRHDANFNKIAGQEKETAELAERMKRVEKYLFDGNGRPALQVTITEIQSDLKNAMGWMKSIASKLDVTDVTARDLKSQLWTAAKVVGSLIGLYFLIANYLKHP
jgi:hypothetical protein